MFTQEVADRICLELADGKPLRQICREIPISKSQVYTWMDAAHADFQPAFTGRFARARVEGFDAIAEECLDIADDTSNDTTTAGSGDAEHEVANTEWISRSKLRVETRLKLLAKWDPKRYGEKLDVTLDVTDRAAILRKKRDERLFGRSE